MTEMENLFTLNAFSIPGWWQPSQSRQLHSVCGVFAQILWAHCSSQSMDEVMSAQQMLGYW